jgi:hypothetical protein
VTTTNPQTVWVTREGERKKKFRISSSYAAFLHLSTTTNQLSKQPDTIHIDPTAHIMRDNLFNSSRRLVPHTSIISLSPSLASHSTHIHLLLFSGCNKSMAQRERDEEEGEIRRRKESGRGERANDILELDAVLCTGIVSWLSTCALTLKHILRSRAHKNLFFFNSSLPLLLALQTCVFILAHRARSHSIAGARRRSSQPRTILWVDVF